jgi:hypothetical protein
MKQGISPLFYWNLKKINYDKYVPSEIIKNLEKIYYSNLARNMLLYDELNKILMAFTKAGIDTVVLKGAFLAEEIYKNIGLRPMSDIDLLIKEEDLQKAKKELIELKYAATIIFSTKFQEQYQTLRIEELPFIHQDKKIYIEIHWDIEPRLDHYHYKIDINKFWNNVKSAKIAGIETLTFAPEDLLQHLCLHVDKHVNLSMAPPAKPLRDYCDIAEVTNYYKDTIDWNYLLKSSKEYGIEEPIFQGMFIAKEYFGAFIPEDIFNEFKPVKSIISFEDIFRGLVKDNSNKNLEMNYLINLKTINGIWNKSRFVFGDIFPSKEYMMYRYSIENEKQVYRYYLVHSGTVLQWGLTIIGQLPKYIFRSTFRK